MQNLVYLIYLLATISFLSPFFLLHRTENTKQIKILKYFLIVFQYLGSHLLYNLIFLQQVANVLVLDNAQRYEFSLRHEVDGRFRRL